MSKRFNRRMKKIGSESHPKKTFLVGLILFTCLFLVGFASAITWDNQAYYDLENTSLLDLTGNGNTGTNSGASTATGKLSGALYFDGVSDYANLTSLDIFSKEDYTISFWIKTTATSGRIISEGIDSGISPYYRIFMDTSGQPKIALRNSTGHTVDSLSNTTINSGSWTHVVFKQDGSTYDWYVDNVEAGTGSWNRPTDTTDMTTIGAGYINGGFEVELDATLDELGIWSRTLSDEEIGDLWNNGNGLEYGLSAALVNLYSPNNGSTISDVGANFTVYGGNVSTLNALWDNITYYVWNASGPVHNITTVDFADAVTFNETLFIDEFTLGDYLWNAEACYVNVTGTYCDFALNNNSFSVFPFAVNQVNFNSDVYETSYQNINLTVTTFPTIQSVTGYLFYDGTEYASSVSCSLGVCSLVNTLDMPLVTSGESENKTFYWSLSVFDGTSQQDYNTSEYNQSVTKIYFTKCNATYTDDAIEFTAAREDNLTTIDPFSFEGNFDYWLGSGTVFKTYSFQNTSASTADFCISPTTETYYLEALINYDGSGNNTGFVERTYRLNNYSINSTVSSITLLLLESLSSTTFVQEVLENKEGVADAYIYTYRYYPGIDSWKITQVTKTDENGKTSGFYKAETATYKHTVVVGGIIRVLETAGRKMLLESVPYTITWNLDVPIDVPWEQFDDLTGIAKSLTYNKDTKIVTFTYTGNSSFTNGNLTVFEEYYSRDDVLVCNRSSSLSVATISCNLSGYEGNFIATGYIEYGGQQIKIDSIRFSIGRGSETFGKGGLLLGWFIILVAGTAFLIHPIIGIVGINISIILVNLIGLISFGWTFVFAIMAVSGALIWLMKD